LPGLCPEVTLGAVKYLAPILATTLIAVVAKADDPPGGACPADMRFIERDHYEVVDRVCTDQRGKHCFAYKPGTNRPRGPRQHMRFCMDVYEAPNQKGARPLVMQSSVDGEAWCKARGKRLCKEIEWESACEGPDMLPWPYGWSADGAACNSAKPWRQFKAEVLMKGGEKGEEELERLWQGEPSGARATCVTKEGIYDLTGSVEEWVVSRPTRRWPTTLIGGFWAKPWPGCRGANDAHEPTFRFYETGFRCCADPQK
jgi:formylglycine-generating enzyme required for sulfatase activity